MIAVLCVSPPTASLAYQARGVPWVSCRDPPVCFRCPGSMASVAERQLVRVVVPS